MIRTESEHSVTSVLSGLTHNLDTVFSGRYHDPKATQEIRDFDIYHIHARGRHHEDGQVCQRLVYRSESSGGRNYFTFPHRGKECIEYGKHILRLFATLFEEHHYLFFSYD